MDRNKSVVGIGEKLGFMSYSTAVNIIYNFRSLYYLIFLTNVLKIPVLTAGTILTLGIIWDGINDPIIGIWCSNYTFRGGEKIRPYILYTAIPWAIFIVLMFTDFKAEMTPTVIIALVIYLLYEVVNTFKDVPYNAMGALASNNDEDRKGINSFRSLGGCLGSGIGAVAVTPIVKMYGGLQGKDAIIGDGDARALFLTAVTMGIICIIGSVIHYATTKERVREQVVREEKIKFIDGYKMLFNCSSWVKNMLYITFYTVGNCLIMTSINYYAAYVLGSSSSATPILAAYLVASIIISLLTPLIDAKLGRKRTMLLGVAVMIIGKIPFILFPKSILMMYINAISVGIGATISFIMFNTNRNNISDIIEIENGKRMDSMVSSADNLASKFGNALVTELIAVSLSMSGFDEALKAAQSTATVNTICALVGWVPLVVCIAMLFVVLGLDPEKEMEQALEKRD